MKNKKSLILLFTSTVVVSFDQIIKFVLRKFCLESIEIIPNKLVIELTNNLSAIGNIKNLIINLIILVLIFNFIKNQYRQIDRKTIFSIGMIIGGIIRKLN